ncbi:hypothetical protein SprV_0200590900 [Sparganum proliferum]
MKQATATLLLQSIIFAVLIGGGSCAPRSNLSVVDTFVDAALGALLEGANEVNFSPPMVNFLSFRVEEITVFGLPSLYRACPLRLQELGGGRPDESHFTLVGCIGANNLSVDMRLSSLLRTHHDLRLSIKPFVINFSLELLPEKSTQLRTRGATSLDEDAFKPRQVAIMSDCALAKWDGIEADHQSPLLDFLVRSMVTKLTQRARMEAQCKKILNERILSKFLFPIYGKNNRKKTAE